MNVRKQIIAKLFAMSILTSLFAACLAAKPEKFAAGAPVKKIIFDQSFPNDLIYQATPDKQVIVGTKQLKSAIYEMNGGVIETPIYEISGFDVGTGKKLWQMSFVGEIVGQTEKQILVYEEKILTVHFVTPLTGEITRKVAPAPSPLSSHNSLKRGMAFSDESYVTTKALYTSVDKGYGNSRQEDESFKIGITGKTWGNDEKLWFVPPVKQIVIIKFRPVILGDKVLIINEPQTADGNQTYQIVSLATGAEIYRGASPEGYFHFLDDKYLIEQTNRFTRRIEPLTGKELWRIEYAAKFAFAAVIGNQITVRTNDGTTRRTIRMLDAETGKLLKQFDLPDLQEMYLKACFVAKDGTVLLNFDSATHRVYDQAHYNYWVAYDAEAKKILWRTDYESHSASSLFPLASDQAQFIEIK